MPDSFSPPARKECGKMPSTSGSAHQSHGRPIGFPPTASATMVVLQRELLQMKWGRMPISGLTQKSKVNRPQGKQLASYKPRTGKSINLFFAIVSFSAFVITHYHQHRLEGRSFSSSSNTP